MVRCYLPPDAWGTSPACLTGREAHHLSDVLRVRKGDRVLCLDGLGRQAQAEVLQSSSREILLRLGSGRQIPPPLCSITLAAAIPGQGKLDQMVSEATQMGAAGILPLITERTVARWAGPGAARKEDHLRRVALEAMKQSGAPRLPVVGPVTAWADLLSSFPQYDRVLIAAVEGPHEPLRPLLAQKLPRRLLLLIGPEGDFSPAEVAQAVAAGARRFSLGPQVLRCETAVVAALAVIHFLLRGECVIPAKEGIRSSRARGGHIRRLHGGGGPPAAG